MKKIILFLLTAGLFTLTGCLDVVEELYLNRDGTGRYHLTMDMSGLFTDPFMKGLMEEAMKKEGMGADQGLEMDTVIYLKDQPDSIRGRLDRPEFWENVVMRMTMSEKQQKMQATIELDFDDIDDIDYFYKNIDQLDAGEGGALMGSGGLFASGALFHLKGGRLTRAATEQKAMDDMNDEDMQFLKMFMSNATYKTIYHLPGKVKKVTIPNATVAGNTVTVENSYLDIMDGKAKMEGEIRFKKK